MSTTSNDANRPLYHRPGARMSSISAIVVFPRKSSRRKNFLDLPTWLLLAREARFWELTGQLQGHPHGA
jgi:hypothetical protein